MVVGSVVGPPCKRVQHRSLGIQVKLAVPRVSNRNPLGVLEHERRHTEAVRVHDAGFHGQGGTVQGHRLPHRRKGLSHDAFGLGGVGGDPFHGRGGPGDGLDPLDLLLGVDDLVGRHVVLALVAKGAGKEIRAGGGVGPRSQQHRCGGPYHGAAYRHPAGPATPCLLSIALNHRTRPLIGHSRRAEQPKGFPEPLLRTHVVKTGTGTRAARAIVSDLHRPSSPLKTSLSFFAPTGQPCAHRGGGNAEHAGHLLG